MESLFKVMFMSVFDFLIDFFIISIGVFLMCLCFEFEYTLKFACGFWVMISTVKLLFDYGPHIEFHEIELDNNDIEKEL